MVPQVGGSNIRQQKAKSAGWGRSAAIEWGVSDGGRATARAVSAELCPRGASFCGNRRGDKGPVQQFGSRRKFVIPAWASHKKPCDASHLLCIKRHGGILPAARLSFMPRWLHSRA